MTDRCPIHHITPAAHVTSSNRFRAHDINVHEVTALTLHTTTLPDGTVVTQLMAAQQDGTQIEVKFFGTAAPTHVRGAAEAINMMPRLQPREKSAA